MKEYHKPSVTSNQEVAGLFPWLVAAAANEVFAAAAAGGAAVGLGRRAALEREQYTHLEAVLC